MKIYYQMNSSLKLNNLSKDIKILLTSFLVTLAIGICMGLIYIYITTDMNIVGVTERYNGSEILQDEIPENFPKQIEAIILTTHNHIITFSIISLILGFIFYFNSVINGFMKIVIMIEPFIGTIVMFGSIWLMRYVAPYFSYVIILSSIITYLAWFIMISVSIVNLNKK